jgi:hypothetical protein
MGTKVDMKRWIGRMWKDNRIHCREINDAQVLIFQVGAPIDGTRVKNILNEKSLVPTRVSFIH